MTLLRWREVKKSGGEKRGLDRKLRSKFKMSKNKGKTKVMVYSRREQEIGHEKMKKVVNYHHT